MAGRNERRQAGSGESEPAEPFDPAPGSPWRPQSKAASRPRRLEELELSAASSAAAASARSPSEAGSDMTLLSWADLGEVPAGEQGEEEEPVPPSSAEEEEPVERVKTLPTPYQPTHSEYCDHCVTHFPFQSWCSHCVEGRGKEFGHTTKPKEPGAAPTVSFDYAFLSDGDEIITQEAFEAAGEGAAKLLIVRDDKSKALFAHVIPAKGIDQKGFSVDQLVDDVKWLGYSKLILKSDNEDAKWPC